MSDEPQGVVETNAEDTAAVLAHASGDKTYVSEPKAEEPKTEETPADVVDAPADPEGEKPAVPAKKQTAQERIDELTRARHDAERERDQWRQRAEAAAPKPDKPPEAKTDDEPDPAQFTYGEFDPGYIKALGKHAAGQEFARLSQEQTQRTQTEAADKTWQDRQAEFAKAKPDFYTAISSPDLAITPVMTDVLKSAEAGPAVAYHLAQNPDEARRIAALTDIAQVRELTKIELSLFAAPVAAPQGKTATDAPEPAPTLRGQGGRFKVAADTDDFAAFETQYAGGT